MTIITPEELASSGSARDDSSVSALRALFTRPLGAVPAIFLSLVVLSAVFAPLIAPHNPNTASLSLVMGPISAQHPLGTDGAGRDVLSRLLFASRFSLAGAFVALGTSAILGIAGGLFAGYYGKWFDTLSSWLVNLLMALPGFVVLLAAITVIGPSLWVSMLIFGVLMSPGFFRLVYASVKAVRNELYIDAARVAGISDARIIGRHVLRVVAAPAVIQAATIAGIAVGIQSGLEFLGFGDPTVPSWGSMLDDGFNNMYNDPTLILWPSLIIALTCIAFALLANALRDELEGSRRRPRRIRLALVTAAGARPTAPAAEPAGAGSLLDIRDLVVAYARADGTPRVVVDGASLSIRRGEVHGLVGESGSGKTQTAWSVLRLLPPAGQVVGGSIHFDGIDITSLSEREMTRIRGSRIAYVPQEPMANLDPVFTVRSQLIEPMIACQGMSRRAADAWAQELLERVGIRDPARTLAAYPHELSGGMAQRVLIAGAVASKPDLLVADEPTTALDVTVQAEVLDLLRDLQQEIGMAILLVTHNFGVVADICDTVSVLQNGRTVESGPVRDVFSRPEHPYTRMLLNAIIDESKPRERQRTPSERLETGTNA